MNKELLKLIDQINAAKDRVRSLVAENRIDEAQEEKKNLLNLQAKFDIVKDIYEEEQVGNVLNPEKKKVKDVIHEFANAARRGFRNEAGDGADQPFDGNNEGVGIDGGYTVPEDIVTRIETLMEASFALADLVDSVTVSTNSGRRTYRLRSVHTGFAKVGEGKKIPKTGRPQFGIMEFKIDKYAGYMPVTNELLEDSDVNIAAEIIGWLADEGLATKNNLVLDKIGALNVAMASLDDLKKAVNVTLGAKFAGMIKIVTNDDGLQYLDTLKDETGRELLKANADTNSPFKMVLAIGAQNIPIVVVPNEVLATADHKVPFIVGALKEYVRIFDRKRLTITQSNVAAVTDFNAFEEDLTIFRAIMRLDARVKDTAAIVKGYITVQD